jgi:hypothetical protein
MASPENCGDKPIQYQPGLDLEPVRADDNVTDANRLLVNRQAYFGGLGAEALGEYRSQVGVVKAWKVTRHRSCGCWPRSGLIKDP